MSPASEIPVDLYIAAYEHESDAQEDWTTIKDLVKKKLIQVHGLLLIHRGADGKIDVKDRAREAGTGAVIGAVGGVVVGLIFPPTLLAAGLIGAGAGAGISKLRDRHQKKEIKADVEHTLPMDSTGILVLFEQQWVTDVERALAHATKVSKHEVDSDSVNDVTTTAEASPTELPADTPPVA